ncbi:MAG TPA: NUDIX hydrolase [Acidimicrobiales bacterium]|jgi:ADP-ribose pyrophosphatase|nr:NUDIX hydrolase [Acidimicrobiales bacterium]
MPAETAGFRWIGERVRYVGSFITLVQGTFVAPDGFTFERDVVRHPGAVCVVPLERDGSVLMVRQYRAPLDAFVLELPAGKLDVAGEAPERCARRELVEEVGREAGAMTHLVSFYNSPGFTDERTACFLAEDLRPVARDHQGVEERHMTVEAVPLDALFELVDAGELVDAKSIIALVLARRALAGRAGEH